VLVNGVRLFFDVEGASLVPEGRTLREKPTLVLLHGGPGFDHSIYKPRFSALADIAQVVFLDHRGNGRSDPGPREAWTLAQWGDDVYTFCEALGIVCPVVLGVSFGGTVAMTYAIRYPAHPAKLVLVSTEASGDTYLERRVALFERFGGPEVARWRAAGSLRRRGTPTRPWSRPRSGWLSLSARACRAIRRSPRTQCVVRRSRTGSRGRGARGTRSTFSQPSRGYSVQLS